ncbi:MAG: hypothetical protein ACYCXQ_00820 [Candidatus Humimicrobiaceae bacterium]
MKKITREILQIVSGTIFLFGGLALILRFHDGRLLIGLLMMAIGFLIFTFYLSVLVVKRW